MVRENACGLLKFLGKLLGKIKYHGTHNPVGKWPNAKKVKIDCAVKLFVELSAPILDWSK